MVSIVAYQHRLEQKEYNVNLEIVKVAIAALSIPGFCGMSGGSVITADFDTMPDDSQKASIDSYWAGLSDASPEATGYYSQDDLKAALQAARADAATKAWDDLSAQQKKLISNAPLSEADNAAIITAFPG